MRWIYSYKWSEYETAEASFLTFPYYKGEGNITKNFAYALNITAISLKMTAAWMLQHPQLTFIFWKSTIKTLEKVVKYVQS